MNYGSVSANNMKALHLYIFMLSFGILKFD